MAKTTNEHIAERTAGKGIGNRRYELQQPLSLRTLAFATRA